MLDAYHPIMEKTKSLLSKFNCVARICLCGGTSENPVLIKKFKCTIGDENSAKIIPNDSLDIDQR